MTHPVYIKFPVVGVHLPDGKYFCNESSCRVELSMLSAKSSGVYKCEVSGDSPLFQLAAKEDNMTVAGGLFYKLKHFIFIIKKKFLYVYRY